MVQVIAYSTQNESNMRIPQNLQLRGMHCSSTRSLEDAITNQYNGTDTTPLIIAFNTHGGNGKNGVRVQWSIIVPNGRDGLKHQLRWFTPNEVWNGWRYGQYEWRGLRELLANRNRMTYIIFGQCYGIQFADQIRTLANQDNVNQNNVNQNKVIIHGISYGYTYNVPDKGVLAWNHKELFSIVRLLRETHD